MIGVDGKPLSEEAARHRMMYRFRCRKCPNTDFCAECLASPYHNGFTCEGFAKYSKSRKCRFCDVQITRTVNRERMKDVSYLQCEELQAGQEVKVNGSDLCSICWVEELRCAPCIRLECGHGETVVLFEGGRETKGVGAEVGLIKNLWSGVRITFGFLECPLCKKHMKVRPCPHGLLLTWQEREGGGQGDKAIGRKRDVDREPEEGGREGEEKGKEGGWLMRWLQAKAIEDIVKPGLELYQVSGRRTNGQEARVKG
eukprot:753021-Hanusia_phi.AAC.4